MSDELSGIKSALESIDRKMKDQGFTDYDKLSEKKSSWMAKIMELCILSMTANGFLFTITTNSISKFSLISSVVLYSLIIITSLIVIRLSGNLDLFFSGKTTFKGKFLGGAEYYIYWVFAASVLVTVFSIINQNLNLII